MIRAQILLVVAVAAAACGEAPPPTEQRFEAGLSAVTDEGQPLAGARFLLDKQVLGSTSQSGTLTVRLRGSEGKLLRLSMECPSGYSPPEALPPLRLTQTRRVGEAGPQPLSVKATCTREMRTVAVVIRAEKGTDLPVQVDGKAAGTTDADGNAHVLLNVDRGTRSITVGFDTTTRPELLPKNPQRVYELGGRDAVVLFEPAFTLAPPKRVPRRSPAPSPAAPPRHVPYRLD